MRFKIVLVPFPFDDLEANKVRPAVCLTEPIGPYEHLVLAFITSRIHSTPLESDLVLNADHPDFSATGLRVSSTLQLHRLMTVSKSILKRQLGELPLALQAETKARLVDLFNLDKVG
jgi:mRNA interferase MazF